VVSGGWRVEVAGWQAYLPVGHSHTPNDDDSIFVVVFAILCSGDVWGWRMGVLGVVRGEWRMEMAGWQAYLPVGLLCAPNDDDSVVVVVFAVLYTGGVGMECRGPGGGPWRVESGDGAVAGLPACRAFTHPK
jgi:hypothetical protein